MCKKNSMVRFEVKWADVDPNMHLRHTVYLDFTDQARVQLFAEHGIPFTSLRKMMLGPVIFGVASSFHKEVLLGESVGVDCKLLGMSEDFRKWHFRQHVYKENGEVAALVSTKGAWVDLMQRKLTIPHEKIIAVMEKVERSEDFQYLK